ncbi:MAG: SDR family NAD(P)-dependent oxidoreductase [Actinobacteria bacterium]|nr:SDR family NAD(P)-dependent oxidoreductase [Actinomycetota bacterium]
MSTLTGAVVLVTGANGGIGSAFVAEALALDITEPHLATAFAPVLTAHPESVLIDMHSVASWYAFGGAYSASKAALWSATNSLRLELTPKGTHVVGVHVGYVDTAMAAHADGPKLNPADLVIQVFDTVEAGGYEVIADELTASIKAGLSAPVEALYPELKA